MARVGLAFGLGSDFVSRLGRGRAGWAGLGGVLCGALVSSACYSEPDSLLPSTEDGTASGTASVGPGGSATAPTTGDDDASGPGPGSNTQGVTGDSSAGDSGTADDTAGPGTDSTDDGPADTGTTGEPPACADGPLAVEWTEAPSIASQPNPQGLAGALIDGDDLLDIAVASYDNHSVSIYLGDGAGGFDLGTQVPTNGNASRVWLAPIADDTPDLFVQSYNAATFQNDLRRWRGDGSGNFQFGMNLGPGQWVTLAHFNGDAYLDVITASGGARGMLEIHAGDVTESFGAPAGLGPHTGSPVAADLDADGDDDLIMVTGSTATVAVNENGVLSAQPAVNLGPPVGAVAIGDPNDDGNLDLVTATLGGGNTLVQMFPGDGAGGLGAPLPYPISNYTAYAESKDFDADGIDDIFLVANSGSLTFLRSNGDGTVESEDVTAVAGCLNARGLVAEDIDGDCIPDPVVVCSGGTEEIRIFLSGS